MSDNHTLSTLGESLVDVVGKTLGGHAYDILVHAVGTRTHDAAESARAKLQVLVEGIHQGRLILIIEHGLHFGLCLSIKKRVSSPYLGFSFTCFD